MFCQNCGKEVTGNFCSNCGVAVQATARQNSESAKVYDSVVLAKTNKYSKLLHIASLVFSVFIYFYSVFKIFLSAISVPDPDIPLVAIGIAACCAPFSLAVLLASALRGKSKVASSIFYILPILSSVFLCCLNLAFSDDFLLFALLNIPFVVLAWIFGNRCALKKVSKAQIIVFVVLILATICFLLYLFSGDIALSRSASNLFEEMSEHSFYDEVETARNLLE